jgi:hypothetical protein
MRQETLTTKFFRGKRKDQTFRNGGSVGHNITVAMSSCAQSMRATPGQIRAAAFYGEPRQERVAAYIYHAGNSNPCFLLATAWVFLSLKRAAILLE